METTTIEVGGMTCQGCVASVTRVLKAVPGVSDANVTLEPGSATVVFDATQTNVAALRAAIEDAGYDARG
ncbi:MAG TPA: heavy metal-associated domain-containing protein [Casimicrobiaceae bacterium]